MLLPLKGRHSDDEAGMSETGLWVPQQKPVLSQPPASQPEVSTGEGDPSAPTLGWRLLNGLILWGPLWPFSSSPPGGATRPQP